MVKYKIHGGAYPAVFLCSFLHGRVIMTELSFVQELTLPLGAIGRNVMWSVNEATKWRADPSIGFWRKPDWVNPVRCPTKSARLALACGIIFALHHLVIPRVASGPIFAIRGLSSPNVSGRRRSAIVTWMIQNATPERSWLSCVIWPTR